MSGFAVDVDADHGGRWTSLRDPGQREWLWHRPDPARDLVAPGDPFVDVGGLEECYPTIGANPDHGLVWSRAWREVPVAQRSLQHLIQVDEVTLSRTIDARRECVVADYQLEASPGTRFVWAAHALLELKVGARLEATAGPARAWPDHKLPVDTSWPTPLGIDYANLGPNDGSAMFCLLPDRAAVTVHDGEDSLRFRLSCTQQPVSFGLWRNLGGYPWSASTKYRNIGVEPMLGRVFDLDAAGEGEAAVVPASGRVSWTLTIDNG